MTLNGCGCVRCATTLNEYSAFLILKGHSLAFGQALAQNTPESDHSQATPKFANYFAGLPDVSAIRRTDSARGVQSFISGLLCFSDPAL
ncbi:hypothetical protein KQX54_005937 [Cotesia glomerata]|uniref:Uncharacterized protein n=1 Tax=Cotesia glomerata TaxID=32391 RepID=A0AAV7J2M7_COTGL|nr:hypothetical protein KQX54_005937 [Cotesia glomerata]